MATTAAMTHSNSYQELVVTDINTNTILNYAEKSISKQQSIENFFTGLE